MLTFTTKLDYPLLCILTLIRNLKHVIRNRNKRWEHDSRSRQLSISHVSFHVKKKQPLVKGELAKTRASRLRSLLRNDIELIRGHLAFLINTNGCTTRTIKIAFTQHRKEKKKRKKNKID